MTDHPVSTRRKPGRRLLVLASAGALLASGAAYVIAEAGPSFAATSANVWLTTADQSNKLTQKAAVTFGTAGSGSVITVNPNTTYQSIVGFGGSMTDAAANNIWNSSARNTIMTNLFGSSGIGLSFLRQPIGTSDFSVQFYSLDDGAADPNLTRFSVARDQSYIIPLLQQAKSLNPGLSVMGSPWSAPGWMKTSGNMVGGSLIGGDESVFASYLVKFVQAYQSAGIPISYLTVANEPQYSPAAYPGMLMSASQESTVINNLKPKLTSAGLNTKLLVLDHNWDLISYAEQVLGATGNNADGTAWHHYGGNVSGQTTVRNAYPSKEVLFTEGSWTSGNNWGAEITGQGGGTAINTLRNWSRTVTFWNLALNPNGGPVNGNGCACTAPVTVNGGNVTYNAEYYVLGHFSKFVKPGAVRIDSNVVGTVNNVAFKNPDGSIALIAVNTGGSAQNIQVSYGGSSFPYSLPAGAMATFTWPGGTVTPTTPPTSPPTTGPPGGGTGAITGIGGKCVDVAGASSANGAAVQLYTCNGTNAQQWTVGTDGTVRALGKCMDVTSAGTANGTKVQLYDCNGTNAQKWTRSGLELVNVGSNRCLDATGNSSADGTRLQIWDCTNAANQQWNLP
jgi:glucosylceramidase